MLPRTHHTLIVVYATLPRMHDIYKQYNYLSTLRLNPLVAKELNWNIIISPFEILRIPKKVMYFFVMLKILNIFISFFVLRTQIRHIPISFVYLQARDLLLHKTTTVTTNKDNLYCVLKCNTYFKCKVFRSVVHTSSLGLTQHTE